MQQGLRRVRIAGFASLREAELAPGPLTVMVGPNGSGKSNVLKALRLIGKVRSGSLGRAVVDAGGASAMLHYGPKKTPRIEIDVEFACGVAECRYALRLGLMPGDRLFIEEETLEFGGGDEWHKLVGASNVQESSMATLQAWSPHQETALAWLAAWASFQFHDTSATSAMRANARIVDDRSLRSDGANLAACLHRLATGESDADRRVWDGINRLTRRVAPCVKRLLPTVDGPAVRLDWIDDRDERFAAHQLSDGTLRAVALIAVLAQPTERLPPLVVVDEPELGLHPSAVGLIAAVARSVSRHTQIVFATQSTAFLDQFEPEEVVVAERVDGATRLTRPDPAALREWLEDYSLSEVFEKGVIGGQP